MKRPSLSISLALLGVFSVACQSAPVRTDAGADASLDDAAATETGGGAEGGTGTEGGNPNAPLSYTPAGCAYMVRTTAGTRGNYLGDTSTFGAGAAPVNVHVNWASSPATTAAILWSTDADTRATSVRYGTAADTLSMTATGHVSTAMVSDGTLTVHEVHLCGLRPATTYYYQVGGEGHYSATQSFTTAPDPADRTAEAIFAVSGDSRDDVTVWRAVQHAVAMQTGMRQPTFQLFSGDAVSYGPGQMLWNDWFTNATETFGRLPIVMAHGNHDALSLNYLMQFAQPQSADANQSELYFSFDYGPVHFVVLNDTVQGGDINGIVGGPERDWLVADLRAVNRANTPWIVAMHHKPCFSSSTHTDDADTRQLRMILPPVYDMFDVDMVFNGHDHDFERTRPLDGTGTAVPTGTHGTVYVTAAGAGASLYPAAMRPWTQLSASVRNFAIVRATRTSLTMTPLQLDLSGTVTPITGGEVTLNR